MNKQEMIELMNGDLANELKHMMFYLFSSFHVRGINRIELQEFLQDAAKSEMGHVTEFAKFIIDLGGRPITSPNEFPILTQPFEILKYAIQIEDEVVKNYTERLAHCDLLGGVDGTSLRIFYEDQIMDSRTDANELRQIEMPCYTNQIHRI